MQFHITTPNHKIIEDFSVDVRSSAFRPSNSTLKQINIPALQNYCDKLKVLTQRWHHLYKTNIEQINALLLQWSSKNCHERLKLFAQHLIH